MFKDNYKFNLDLIDLRHFFHHFDIIEIKHLIEETVKRIVSD